MKRGLFVIFLLLVQSVFAVTITYTFNQDNILFDIYKCNDNQCSQLSLLDQLEANQNLAYNYAQSGYHLYATYKNCFYPSMSKVEISEAFDGTNKNINLNRKSLCSAEISSLTKEGNLEIRNPITIKTIIKGPFNNDFNPSSFINFIPNNRKEFLTSNVNVRLFDNDVLVEEKKINFYLDESKEIIFNFVTSSPGAHKLRIQTSSDDCKCAKFETKTKELSLNLEGTLLPEATNNQSAAQESVSQNQVSPEPVIISGINNPATCEENDGCNSQCKKGDPDCSCSDLSGSVCKEGENCKGTLMRNYGDQVCCSIKCTLGTSTDTSTPVRYFTSEKVAQQQNKPKDMGIKVDLFKESLNSVTKSALALIGIGFLILIFSVLFTFHVEHFKFDPLQKSIDFIEKELLMKKKLPEIKKQTEEKQPEIDDFLKELIGKLSNDESKIVKEILKSPLKQDELRLNLGFSKEKLNYNLIRLERRQIIKKRIGDNPKIVLNDWLLK